MKRFIKKTYRQFLRVPAVIVILLLLALPAVYTNSVFGYLPIVAVLFLMLISGITMLILKRNISIDMIQENAQTTRGQKVTVDLKVANKSFLVCPRANAEIFISDYFGNDDSVTSAVFSLDRKSTTDFGFDIKMEHVGVYTAGIRNMKIYGLLGLFSVQVPFENSFSVIVLPQINEHEVTLSDDLITDSPDAASFSENDGFDYTGVREYVLGDSMKKIHWKLSAHSMGYMTKINEVGLKSDMAVIVDVVSDEKSEENMLFLNDGIIETAIALTSHGDKLDIDYQLLYVDKEKTLKSIVPRSDYDYIELIRQIAPITNKPSEDMPDAEQIILEEMQFANRSANLMVCTSRVTEGLLQALIDVKNQQRNPMLYLFVNPDANERDKREAAAKIRMLDEFGIYYEIVSSN